jgi:hypothetical protein
MALDNPQHENIRPVTELPLAAAPHGVASSQPQIGDWLARGKDGEIIAWAPNLRDLDEKLRSQGREIGDVTFSRYYDPDEFALGGVQIGFDGE